MSLFEEIKDNPKLERLRKKALEYLEVARNIACEYCGLRSGDAPQVKFHIDHIVPRCFGGTDDPENLADCCAPCNWRKRDRRGWKTLSGRIGKSSWMVLKNGVWSIPPLE